jgi:outer membrane protein OmpA-like peptidoglycan-associated protein
MKVKFALLAASGAMALTSAATAQEWYGELGAGITYSQDSLDLESEGAFPAEFDGDVAVDSTVAVFGAIGKYLGQNYRAELELAHREQEIVGISGSTPAFNGFPSNDELGDIAATTLMVNVFKDFPIGDGYYTPYVGIGAGVARIASEYDNQGAAVGIFGPGGSLPDSVADMALYNEIAVDDDQYTGAYQAIAGMTFDFTDNMELDLRYRYLHTGGYEHDALVNGVAAEVESEYRAHEVLAGFKWNFGAAPVAAAPAPAPVEYKTCFDGSRIPVTQNCPPQVVEEEEVTSLEPLVVYFDYDKSNLTGKARELIEFRADEALEAGVRGVNVEGNTDTSGSSSYNQALSKRRADVVAAALVDNGISGGIITVEALGESNPAVVTGDGVKEPLNRRTEVTFEF